MERYKSIYSETSKKKSLKEAVFVDPDGDKLEVTLIHYLNQYNGIYLKINNSPRDNVVLNKENAILLIKQLKMLLPHVDF